jgi:ring-1,2-phenylacetyl-CoA epoxidase subunit PaaC
VSAAIAERTGTGTNDADRFHYVLRVADTSLVLGQRLGEWIGHAPVLEEDLGLANLSLDLIGQARLLLTHAAELEGRGRDEDQLAFLRDGSDFCNATLAEQPNGDFATTIVRQCLLDAWQLELYAELEHSTDRRLAEIAAKALKETQYHFRYSANWLIRLGDGTEQSKRRTQEALDALWRFTAELFTPDALDEQMAARGVAPDVAKLRPRWQARIDSVLREATLDRPTDVSYPWQGKRGQHSEHLGYLLAEMQFVQRTYPGSKW